jgi:exonuclease III
MIPTAILTLTILLRLSLAAPLVSWQFSAVTWNVNGVAKIRNLFPEQRYLSSFDAIFLQETFATEDVLPYELDGFIAYHTPARYTTRRPQWGMSCLLKISSFVGGRLQSLPAPCEWIQTCRWVRPSGLGVLFINIYVPTHSTGTTVHDVAVLAQLFGDIATSFPGDAVVCCGDFNVDRWRLADHLAARRPTSSIARYDLNTVTILGFAF